MKNIIELSRWIGVLQGIAKANDASGENLIDFYIASELSDVCGDMENSLAKLVSEAQAKAENKCR